MCVTYTAKRFYYKTQQLLVCTTPGCPSVRSHTAPQDAADGKHQEGVDHWVPPPSHGPAGEAAAGTQLHPGGDGRAGSDIRSEPGQGLSLPREHMGMHHMLKTRRGCFGTGISTTAFGAPQLCLHKYMMGIKNFIMILPRPWFQLKPL